MIELEQAVKTICLSPQPEDHYLIFDLQKKTIELENKLDVIKLKLQQQEGLKLQELKNSLNIELIKQGYETIDTENLEVK